MGLFSRIAHLLDPPRPRNQRRPGQSRPSHGRQAGARRRLLARFFSGALRPSDPSPASEGGADAVPSPLSGEELDLDRRFQALLENTARRNLALLGLVLSVQPVAGLGILLAAITFSTTSIGYFPLPLETAVVAFPSIMLVGLGLIAASRLPRAGRFAPAVMVVGLLLMVLVVAWGESPTRQDGGPSVMPFIVLLGVTVIPFRPLPATAVAVLAAVLYLLAVAYLPTAQPVPTEVRWAMVQGSLPFVLALAVTALVVSAASYATRARAIDNQIQRDVLSEQNAAQALALEAKNRALIEAQNELVRRRHLAILANLVAGVAHDLNNPTGALRGSVDVLGRAVGVLEAEVSSPSPKARRALFALKEVRSSAGEAAGRIARVVRSLRLFARLDEAEEQAVDVHECLESAIARLSRELGEVELVRDLTAGPKIVCRPALLNEVFLDLLGNAVDAVAGRGRIVVRSRFEDLARFSIIDDGPGIDPDRLERIFEPGYTTKGRGVGVGLGLSTSLQIIEEHGGRIEVSSSPGQGSTFTVALPMTPSEASRMPKS